MAQVLAEKLIKAAKKHQQDFFKKNTLNGANPDREISFTAKNTEEKLIKKTILFTTATSKGSFTTKNP